jgi:hypothetical protein
MIKTRTINRARCFSMVAEPGFKGFGIGSAFIYHLEKIFEEMPQYKELEFSLVGDFNPPMSKLQKSICAKSANKYNTYRYLFDRNAIFKKYPIKEGR